MDLQEFSLYDEVDTLAQNQGKDVYSFYEESIKKRYSLFKKTAKILFSCLFKLLFSGRSKKQKNDRKNVFFLFFKFIDIIEAENAYFNVIVGEQANPMSLKQLLKTKKIGFINTYNAVRDLDLGYLRKNSALSQRAVDYLINQFKKCHIDIIILGNDRLFIERACVLAAKTLNIPVVCYQHGIVGNDANGIRKSKGSKDADSFWCWGDNVKRAFMEAYSWPPEKVSVMGYPYIARVEKFKKIRENLVNTKSLKSLKSLKPLVLFAGVYYSHYSEEDGKAFEKLSRLVWEVCQELNYDFVYRCHTGENGKEVQLRYRDNPDFNVSYGRELYEQLSEASLIIGDQSSIMVEGALLGINAIQVIRDERTKKSTENPVYSFTYKVANDKEAIKETIRSVIESGKPPVVNPDTFFLNTNIVEDVRDEILNITEKFSSFSFTQGQI